MKETRFMDTEVGRIPEDWEVKRLEEVCEFRNGYTPSKAISSYWNNGTIPWFRMEDIRTNGHILFDSILHVTPQAIKGGLFPKNSIILSTTATIGEHAWIIADSLANQRFTNLKIRKSLENRLVISYFYWYCYILGEWCRNNINQGGLAAVNMPNLYNLQVPIPTIEEQSRIASALTGIDNLIASLDKLIEKKKNIKQGTMQQLLTGKKRMKGFCGDWKTLRLGNCASIKARIGWQGLTTNEYLPHGDYYLISGSDFQNGRVLWDSCYFVSEDRFSQDKNIQIQDKDVLVSKDGTIGKVAYLDDIPGKGTLNSGVFVIRSKTPELTQDYLALVFRSMFFDAFIDKIVAGSTIVHLYQKDIVNFSFLVPPTIAEQLALSKLITTMESEILSLEEKRDKFLCIKQGMMQQLLSGRIRLVQ